LKEKRSPASGIDREYLLKIVQVINLYYIYVRKSAILIADTNSLEGGFWSGGLLTQRGAYGQGGFWT
jgi:hypothetical protein